MPYLLLKKAAKIRKQEPPYIFRYFNVSGLHVSGGSSVKSGARLLNPLIHAMNEETLLPKYIVMVPDKDIVQYLHYRKCTSALVMGSVLNYIITEIDQLIEDRKKDLLNKKPGAVVEDDKTACHNMGTNAKAPQSNHKQWCFCFMGKIQFHTGGTTIRW